MAAAGSSAILRAGAMITFRSRRNGTSPIIAGCPYHVPANADWWVPFYPTDNMQRPTGPLCDGCHSVNYDIATKTVTEWNVGCEACHGAGGDHVANPTRATIVNPARLDYVAASDTCIRCHSQGRPLTNPIDGKYYDWPVGFHMGLQLSDFWALEAHKPGETSFTHFPDGTAHKNRMQGNDFVQSLMYTRGVTCFSCHDPHGNDNVVDAARERQRALSHLPCAERADGPPRREHRGAHASQARQRRQPVRLLSHAGDRGNSRRRQCSRSHVPLHHPGGDRGAQDSQRLQSVPRRQDSRMGRGRVEKLERAFAVADAGIK